MPRAEILSKQALHTLTQLHAELAGKIETNRKHGDKLRAQMVQVEAVMKMLDPDFNARAISAKRRNTGNPWFKRGTLFRSAVDVLRRSPVPMTAREITMAVLEGKRPEPTRKQETQSAEKTAGSSAQKEDPKAFWEKVTTDPVATFTLCLVIIAAAQAAFFVVQLTYMRIGMRDATIAAEAAQAGAVAAVDAARIARNAERPYFTPRNEELRNWKESLIANDEYGVLSFHFQIENIGKGVGFFERYGIAHQIATGPSDIGAQLTERNVGGRMPIRSDAHFVAGLPYTSFQISATERGDIIRYLKTLYVYGFLQYTDLFGIRRNTGFMFEFVPDGASFGESNFAMLPHPFWNDTEIPEK